MRPSLKSSAIAALIGGCAIAGIAVASAGTPRDRAEHRSPAASTSSTSMPTSAAPTEHAGSTEAVHSGRGATTPRPPRCRRLRRPTVPATREATETEHPNPGDDNDATETEHPNPRDDNGGATEPGDDRSGHDSGSDDSSGSGDSSGPGDNSGPGGGDSGSGGGHSGSDG